MRKIISEQMKMGQIDIKDIQIELDTHDEIWHLLRGLQHLYANEATRHEIFMIHKTLQLTHHLCKLTNTAGWRLKHNRDGVCFQKPFTFKTNNYSL